MFEISWSEMMIVGVAALIVLGPKDLPVLMRTIGRYAGWAKRQVGSFREQLDAAVRDADLDLVRREMEEIQKAASRDTARLQRSQKPD
ncbi:Sec-independent protein translocase protein TatB [Hyphomicrobium sp.]|uniref:Sec-independent protein translocase protein TatB n=1 Tax=Hyphomicrobium sp. TaxID=82 RepID=UPI002E3226A5|nr:Sec-independent protein translocase protein TatB [Hyphomicrobium sp.]HEX2841583.1 Sec-independent protein translocase protein TatB [Hyphomicrobium sp.]